MCYEELFNFYYVTLKRNIKDEHIQKLMARLSYRIEWNSHRRCTKRSESVRWNTNCIYQVIGVGLMLYIKYSELERWQQTMTFNLKRNVWLRRLYCSRGCCRCCFYTQLLYRILKVFLLMFFSLWPQLGRGKKGA